MARRQRNNGDGQGTLSPSGSGNEGTANTGATNNERQKGHANAALLEQAKAGNLTVLGESHGVGFLVVPAKFLPLVNVMANGGTADTEALEMLVRCVVPVPFAPLVGVSTVGLERAAKAADPDADRKKAVAELLAKGYTEEDIITYARSLKLEK